METPTEICDIFVLVKSISVEKPLVWKNCLENLYAHLRVYILQN